MLPDLLRPGLRVVFCGTAVATASKDRGHYYAGPGNKFWQLLHDAGFTPELLTPERDDELLNHGIGITDLVKDVAQSHDRGLDFSHTTSAAQRLIKARPSWVAFNGLTAGRAAVKQLGLYDSKAIRTGEQSWKIGSARVFVLPSSSGANASVPYSEKLELWSLLRNVSV